ncbi:hypothetical protein GW17_00036142 [Ensete ventricosum]|nr:hypothetical protein GW17_00036142 [Ensete ventricosum]
MHFAVACVQHNASNFLLFFSPLHIGSDISLSLGHLVLRNKVMMLWISLSLSQPRVGATNTSGKP